VRCRRTARSPLPKACELDRGLRLPQRLPPCARPSAISALAMLEQQLSEELSRASESVRNPQLRLRARQQERDEDELALQLGLLTPLPPVRSPRLTRVRVNAKGGGGRAHERARAVRRGSSVAPRRGPTPWRGRASVFLRDSLNRPLLAQIMHTETRPIAHARGCYERACAAISENFQANSVTSMTCLANAGCVGATATRQRSMSRS